MNSLFLIFCVISVTSASSYYPLYYGYQPLNNYQPYPVIADYTSYGMAYPQPYYYYGYPYQLTNYAPTYAHTSGSVYPTTDRDGRIFLLETLAAYKTMSLGSALF